MIVMIQKSTFQLWQGLERKRKGNIIALFREARRLNCTAKHRKGEGKSGHEKRWHSEETNHIVTELLGADQSGTVAEKTCDEPQGERSEKLRNV